jgi:general secretion pathway protein L
MLAEAFDWWAARMAELVPAWVVRRQAGRTNALVIVPGGDFREPATLLVRRNQQETARGVVIPNRTDRGAVRAMLDGQLKGRAILLRTPPGSLLEKRMDLPLAAAPELGRVIGYDMGRITPFSADEVFWTWVVEAQDRARGRLRVLVSLVPKAPLQPLLAALEEVGLRPTALEAAPGRGEPRLIPLHQAVESAGWRRHATLGLTVACAVLAFVAVGLPFLQQALALGEVEDRIAALQPRVAQVQALRQRIAAESAGRDAVADERVKVGNTLEVLAAITDLLPDDTFLNDVALRQRRLTISGQSTAAPKLIAVLASDPMFRNPGFAAPVTRNEAAKADVFSIRAEVGP